MECRWSISLQVVAPLMVAACLCSGCGGGSERSLPGSEAAHDTEVSAAQEKAPTAPATPSVECEVIRNEIDDMPIKTQVARHLVTSRETSPEDMRALLLSQRDAVSAMRGFTHHSSPTHIGVYAYDSAEKARAGTGQWLGMLLQLPGKAPEVTLRDDLLGRPAPPPGERFGLSEVKRQGVYKAIVACEDRGTLAAIEREPNDFERQLALEKSLWETYKNELAQRNGLTRAQLDSLSQEGIEKDWSLQ